MPLNWHPSLSPGSSLACSQTVLRRHHGDAAPVGAVGGAVRAARVRVVVGQPGRGHLVGAAAAPRALAARRRRLHPPHNHGHLVANPTQQVWKYFEATFDLINTLTRVNQATKYSSDEPYLMVGHGVPLGAHKMQHPRTGQIMIVSPSFQSQGQREALGPPARSRGAAASLLGWGRIHHYLFTLVSRIYCLGEVLF